MRGLDKIATLLMLVMALWAFFGEDREGNPQPRIPPMAEAPQPPPPVLVPPQGDRVPPQGDRVPLPPPSPRDPVFEVQGGGGGGNSTGTAFSVDQSGLWLTARHVAQGCRQIGLRGRQGWVRGTLAWAHPQADVAFLRTQGGTPPFVLAGDAPVRGMDGFGMGFPQGKPGAVQGRLLGRAQMQARGLFQGRAPTLEWAEVRRAPSIRGSLGGISGGPLLDANGNVLGVMVAEEPRRGRFSTAAPETLLAFAGPDRQMQRAAPGTRAIAVVPDRFGAVADQLRSGMRIAQVMCQG
ncbi:serine protease [Elioraea sp.]|uniref:S1 family peptidase n=1 Tax=Elioraea sp. TaxID=2185103 RepID=UPI0025BA638B|nr:serine protease [Elioraea sp.]